MLDASHARPRESGTDFETFGGRQAQHGLGEISFELVENGFAQSGWNATDHALNDPTTGFPRCAFLISS